MVAIVRKFILVGAMFALGWNGFVFSQEAVTSPGWLVSVMGQDGTDRDFGSGIIVRQDGLVASDWNVVAGMKSAKIGVPGKGRFDANEIYAASRGKSLVILKMKNPLAGLPVPKLLDSLPSDSDNLSVLCMANASRSQAAHVFGPVNRFMTGEQLVDSCTSRPVGIGLDRDTTWMRVTALFGAAQRGGAVLTGKEADALLAGIVVASPIPKDSLVAAVHAQHLQELLDNPLPQPLALEQLHKHVDAPAMELQPAYKFELSDSLWERGLPIIDRLQRFANRKQLIDNGIKSADENDKAFRKELGPLKDQMDKIKVRARNIEAQLRKVKPEGAVPSYSYKRERADRPKGDRDETVVVPGFVVWNPEVVAAAGALVNEYRALEAQWGALNKQVGPIEAKQVVSNFDRELFEHMQRRLSQQLWLQADIAGHRPKAEHEAAVDEWGLLLEDRSLKSAALIGRSWSYLHLGKLTEAEQDLREAAKLSHNKAVGLASFARLLYRQGKTEPADAQRARAETISKSEAVAMQVLGLIACERKEFKVALDCFQRSASLPGDPSESQRLIALVLASGSEDVRNGKQAIESALRACQLTHWQDEMSLLTLAAAHAENGEFGEARRRTNQAESIAEGELVAPALQTMDVVICNAATHSWLFWRIGCFSPSETESL